MNAAKCAHCPNLLVSVNGVRYYDALWREICEDCAVLRCPTGQDTGQIRRDLQENTR